MHVAFTGPGAIHRHQPAAPLQRRLPFAGAVEHRLDRQREFDRLVVDGVLDAFLDQVQLQR
jgi:hypothetical protein